MGKDFDPRGDSRLVGGLVPSRSSGVISREGGLLRRFGKAVSVCGVCHSARAPARGGGVFSAAAPCAGRALSVAASCGERVPAASCGAFASRGVSMRARHGAGPATEPADENHGREASGICIRNEVFIAKR